jgi:hypothetical protein
MPAALINETKIAIGRVRQGALHTANVLANFARFNKINTDLFRCALVRESDAAWIGKGHEFAENSWPSHWEVSGQLQRHLSAEFAAWAFAMALGKVVTVGAGPTFTHTITPLDTVTDGIELPAFSVIEAIRQGASDVFDRMLVGCCIEDLTLRVQSGVGVASTQLTVNVMGCGKRTMPSGIVIPIVTPENLLPSASLALSVNGTDYVTTKRIIDYELSIKNNIRKDSGYYPGSGFQTADPTSGQVMGRMEHGTRTLSARINARLEDGSTELALSEAGTEGTAVLTLSGGNATSLQVTLQRTVIQQAQPNNADGIVSVEVDLLPLMHAVNGLIEVEAVCTLATVG